MHVAAIGAQSTAAIVIDEQCFDGSDGSIELNPSGSNSPYSVVWDTTTSIPGSSTAFVQSPLQPGVYTATITDASGCEITEDYTVAEADPITATISFISPSCFGLSNGSATITTSAAAMMYRRRLRLRLHLYFYFVIFILAKSPSASSASSYL